jgi:hypothetical protein
MQRLFNGLSADRRLILKIAMHQIFYKRILVMCLIKKRDLLFYIEELRITGCKHVFIWDCFFLSHGSWQLFSILIK